MPSQWRVIFFLIGFLMPALPALAQDMVGPIVIVDGYNRSPEPNAYALHHDQLSLLDDALHVTAAALSPDGRLLAANVMAAIVFESEGCSGPIPVDLWLLKLETGETRMLIGQPEDATYCGDDSNISRSMLDWSPDGSQFVWTEYHSGDETLSLGVYDVETGQTTRVALDFPEQLGAGPMPLTPTWLNSGIAFYSVTYDWDTADSAVSVRLYRPDGALIAETPVRVADEYGIPDTLLLVTHAGRDYAAYHWFNQDYWALYELLDQQLFWFGETPAYPERVSATQPETSLRVRLLPVDADLTRSENPYQIEVLDSSGDTVLEPTAIKSADDIPQVVVLSPDGQTLAFRPYNRASRVYENQIHFVGADAAPPFIPDGDMRRFLLAWGRSRWVFSDELELAAFPEVLG